MSKKAARPSTIRCGCRPPDAPCALCTGRPDPTHPRDHPDLMTVNERIALLDPAFHPVLSFPSGTFILNFIIWFITFSMKFLNLAGNLLITT